MVIHTKQEYRIGDAVKLIERIIQNTTNEGDTVLAPFLGSGTDLEAGRRTNRNVLGFEIDPQWEHLYPKRSLSHTPTLQYHFERARR